MHENTNPRHRVANLSDLKTHKPECSYHYKARPPTTATMSSTTELQNMCKFKTPTQKSSPSPRRRLNCTCEQQEGVACLSQYPCRVASPLAGGVSDFPTACRASLSRCWVLRDRRHGQPHTRCLRVQTPSHGLDLEL